METSIKTCVQRVNIMEWPRQWQSAVQRQPSSIVHRRTARDSVPAFPATRAHLTGHSSEASTSDEMD
ncbi:Hypothetical predicted protein [Cloeon dipterum]|uniref:Uncharacterized protein n=1 Tax=Cloeon dipterum TaxID=197152 RepID=A0A8S1DL65_9INSE|nr:Hypothetical predicted protein [Cloeon dipterum]